MQFIDDIPGFDVVSSEFHEFLEFIQVMDQIYSAHGRDGCEVRPPHSRPVSSTAPQAQVSSPLGRLYPLLLRPVTICWRTEPSASRSSRTHEFVSGFRNCRGRFRREKWGCGGR